MLDAIPCIRFITIDAMATLTAQSASCSYLPGGSDKPPIPVIRNVIRNEELTKLKDGLNVLPTISKGTHLLKILKLMTDKHSKHLIDRHARAINKLSVIYKYGVHLKDIKILLGIITKCHEYLSLDSLYEDLLCSLVNMISIPFLKSKVSDEESFLYEVSESLNQLGSIAEASSDKVKVVISASLSTLYTSKGHNHQFSDCRPVSKTFIKSIVEKSRICKSLAECITQVSDYESRYILMKSLNNLSDSSVNCNDMLKAEVAGCICNNLSFDMHVYKLLFVGVETLWNILDNGDQAEVARQLATYSCLSSLQSVFINQMSQCTSYADRQLRNDIVVIISLIALKYPLAPFVECGLTKTIAVYSIYPEIPTNDAKIRQLNLTTSPEDFELKKLFLNLIAVLCNNPLSVNVMSIHHVMFGLFSYIIPIKETNETLWTLAEFEEIQLQAIAVLSILSPLRIKDYMNCQGNARLLAMLDWCVSADEFFGHGNSFYGIGGQGNKRAQMRLCIRVIRNMCATNEEEVCQDLSDQGLINQLVAILLSCSSSIESNDAVDIEIQCDMLFILSFLCEDNMHRKSLFGEQGVNMALQYLEGYINIRKDPLSNRIVLSTIDCLGAAVVGCYMNEIFFLKREGAFMLLDLLDMCPENMKNIVLVTIADLVENNNAIPHLMMWRGNTEKTVAKALIGMWADEERILNVHRETYGVIADISRPLLTSYQEKDGIDALPSTYQTPAIVDVSDNLRSKIYGIFCKVGFNNIPGLNSGDYITLAIIEKYLDFKTLEVWQEIKKELEIEKTEPIPLDKECIDEILFILQSKALTVTVIQKALIESNFEQAIMDEKYFYEKIKETYKQKEKSYQDFFNYVNRTSDYTILKNTKKQQLKLIDGSRLLSKRPTNSRVLMHKTMDRSLQTTTFCGRHLLVESTKFNVANDLNDKRKSAENNVLSELFQLK